MIKQDYYIISNGVWNNPNVTSSAKLLYMGCTNIAPDCIIKITDIAKQLGWNERKLTREFKCLVDNGYAYRIRIHGEYHYTFSDYGDLNK